MNDHYLDAETTALRAYVADEILKANLNCLPQVELEFNTQVEASHIFRWLKDYYVLETINGNEMTIYL